MDSTIQGKTVLITGATNGIGKFTALALAKQGARVVIVGRSEEKLRLTAQAIQSLSSADVRTLRADLSSIADIRALAEAYRQQFDRLDVLINNAGGFFFDRRVSADGFEMTFALNHLSYFLLTNLLLDILKASAPARILNVSSDAHRGSRGINFERLGYGSAGFSAYSDSKLMNLLFTYELARRLQGTGVTANALHPGLVATGFGMNNNLFVRGALLIMRPFSRTPERGADTSIYLAASPQVEGISGQYFVDRQAVRSSAASYDEAAQRRLWALSEQMTGMKETQSASMGMMG
jgi:NAD(P)-dependent dehydrogenase (short-subunit alcohol dehydrogenase family)